METAIDHNAIKRYRMVESILFGFASSFIDDAENVNDGEFGNHFFIREFKTARFNFMRQCGKTTAIHNMIRRFQNVNHILLVKDGSVIPTDFLSKGQIKNVKFASTKDWHKIDDIMKDGNNTIVWIDDYSSLDNWSETRLHQMMIEGLGNNLIGVIEVG